MQEHNAGRSRALQFNKEGSNNLCVFRTLLKTTAERIMRQIDARWPGNPVSGPSIVPIASGGVWQLHVEVTSCVTDQLCLPGLYVDYRALGNTPLGRVTR